MIKTTLTWMCVLQFLLFSSCRSQLTQSLFQDAQLYEGNPCPLGNGTGVGVCTRVVNCPGKMREIQNGSYSDSGRCGFSNFDEIVCCATNLITKIENQERPADAACKRYKKIVSELEDGTFFYTVVFNGVAARAGEFPHMAALGYPASDDEEGAIRGIKYVCGGTLISEKHIVTAAHCVSNVQELVPVEVLLGTIDLTKPDPKGMQRIPISRIIKHPDYRRSLNYHDVAILELQNSIRFSGFVQPTCLTTKPTNKTGNAGPRLDVLGWGAIDLEGTTSTKLLKATGLKIVKKNDCSKSYKNNRAHIPNGLNEGMICVVDPNVTRRADTCWGDSGGPLLISSSAFPPLAGVTSFGQACGGTTPGVYASIYQYLNWIEEQVWPTSN